MVYYIFLTVSVTVLLALCWILWIYTKNIAFPFGIAVLYFWSLHGAWALVTDGLGGDSQMHYHYLLRRMFPVYLDENYAWTLGIYAAFILITILSVLYWVQPTRLPRVNLSPIVISHDRIILLCGIAAILSFWIMKDSLSGALQLGESAYLVTRLEVDNVTMFHLHQILNRMALVPLSIGIAILLAGGRCRLLVGARCLRHFVGYGVLLTFMFCFCVVLGNKNELALSLVSACLFYLVNSTQPRSRQLVICGVVLIACVGFIDFARTFSIDEIGSKISLGEIVYSLVRLANSNEAYAAHMSLYGVLSYDVPLTYGSSVYSFLASAIPRALWPDRPESIYSYYELGAGLVPIAEGQGYTVHHATGWYLNFGIPGVIVGAYLLGIIWAALFNNVIRGAFYRSSTVLRLFYVIGFFTFTANLPTLIRSGPEGYKGMIIDGLLTPMFVLSLSRTQTRSSLQRGTHTTRMRIRPTTTITPTHSDRAVA